MFAEESTESTERSGSQDSAALWDAAAPWAATAEGHQRSLRSKLVLSLAAMCALFLIIDEVVRRSVIRPAFEDLEQASAMRDTNRVMSAIRVESEHLRAIAEQGVSRLRVSDIRSARIDTDSGASWNETALQLEGVKWAAVIGSDRSCQWISLKGDEETSVQRYGDAETLVSRILRSAKQQPSDGLVCDGQRRIHAYATAPVNVATVDVGPKKMTGNHSETQVRYHLVVGKELDQELIAELRRRTQVTFSIQVYHDHKVDEKIRTWEADSATFIVEVPLVQDEQTTLANLFVQVPRDVVQQAQHTTALARNVFVCGAAVTLVLMLMQLQRIVVGPLKRIREHTERIAESGLDAGPLSMTSNDEIGALATAFDHMKLRLADTHKRLADASHAAGMSQVADTVIHNVGNVLTNVNSLIETATDRVDGLRISPLNKLATRLKQNQNQEAMFQAMPDYLERLSAELENDQSELSALLSTLNDNVQHIYSVIRDQRRHTMTTVDHKPFLMNEIVAEAISCCQAKLKQDAIIVEVDAADEYLVQSDRSLLLQIMINLIGNAGNAMGEMDCKNPRLKLSLTRRNDHVRLDVRDHGCGMTAETISKVFNAHFTTRAEGTGLGLHFCAITLKRLGGRIFAHSEGLGAGSTFSIELPIANRSSEKDFPGTNSFSIPTLANPIDTSFANVLTQANL